jgi:hypothetical protein
MASAHCKLASAHCKLASAHCKLASAHCKLASAHCNLVSCRWISCITHAIFTVRKEGNFYTTVHCGAPAPILVFNS